MQLKENNKKLIGIFFQKNPNIFTYDYKKIKENMKKHWKYRRISGLYFSSKQYVKN